MWDGCRDYAGELCLPYVIDFWEHTGPCEVRAYCGRLIRGATDLLCEAWDVRLPQALWPVPETSGKSRSKELSVSQS